jgi:hypothetical protein
MSTTDVGPRSHAMFTVEQRDALRERVLGLAEEDERVVAGALVGSLAVDRADRFSDLDLTFGIADHVRVADVLDDWTRTLIDELDGVHLAELGRGPTTYRVFLLPDALQLDLSMTPAARFRPAGPRFRLLFGETTAGESESPTPPVAGDLFISTPVVAGDIFGWGVIYALHARACIERGRGWQAEHYIAAVRDHALARLPPRGAARGPGARFRRPFRRDPRSIRGCPRRRRRTRSAPGGARRLRARSHARGLGGASRERSGRRGAPRRASLTFGSCGLRSR